VFDRGASASDRDDAVETQQTLERLAARLESLHECELTSIDGVTDAALRPRNEPTPDPWAAVAIGTSEQARPGLRPLVPIEGDQPLRSTDVAGGPARLASMEFPRPTGADYSPRPTGADYSPRPTGAEFTSPMDDTPRSNALREPFGPPVSGLASSQRGFGNPQPRRVESFEHAPRQHGDVDPREGGEAHDASHEPEAPYASEDRQQPFLPELGDDRYCKCGPARRRFEVLSTQIFVTLGIAGALGGVVIGLSIGPWVALFVMGCLGALTALIGAIGVRGVCRTCGRPAICRDQVELGILWNTRGVRLLWTLGFSALAFAVARVWLVQGLALFAEAESSEAENYATVEAKADWVVDADAFLRADSQSFCRQPKDGWMAFVTEARRQGARSAKVAGTDDFGGCGNAIVLELPWDPTERKSFLTWCNTLEGSNSDPMCTHVDHGKVYIPVD